MSLLDSNNIRYSGTQTNDEERDYLDAVVDTSPTERPVLALMARAPKATNPLQHEWQLYYRARPTSVANAAGEGTDFTFSSTAERPFLRNRTGIITKSVAVSNSHMASALVGISDPLDFERFQLGEEIANELEYAVIQQTIDVDSTGPNTSTAGTKRKAGGLEDQIVSSAANDGAYVLSGTVAANARAVNTSAGTLTSADIEDAYNTMTDRGGNPNGSKILLARRNVLKAIRDIYSPITGSANILRRDFGKGDQTMVNLVVEAIETAAGLLYAVASPDVDADSLIVWDPEFFQYVPFRDLQFYDAPTGLGDWEGTSGLVEYTTRLLAPNTAFRLHTLTLV